MASRIGTAALRLTLASTCVLGARASAAERAWATEAPRVAAATRHAPRRGIHSRLDERIGLLTRRLDLDPRQQAELRRLLLNQREQVKQVWADHSMPAADHVGATRAILERTGEQIRAMLNEDQRRKFGEANPLRTAEHPVPPDVEHWMRLSRPRAGVEARSPN